MMGEASEREGGRGGGVVMGWKCDWKNGRGWYVHTGCKGEG